MDQQPLMVRLWPGWSSGFPATYLPNADLHAAESDLRGGSSEPIGQSLLRRVPCVQPGSLKAGVSDRARQKPTSKAWACVSDITCNRGRAEASLSLWR